MIIMSDPKQKFEFSILKHQIWYCVPDYVMLKAVYEKCWMPILLYPKFFYVNFKLIILIYGFMLVHFKQLSMYGYWNIKLSFKIHIAARIKFMHTSGYKGVWEWSCGWNCVKVGEINGCHLGISRNYVTGTWSLMAAFIFLLLFF